jgi:hypothetical protein
MANLLFSSETTTDYSKLMTQFDVIGDGTTLCKFQGVTMDPADIWSPSDQTKGGAKVSNAPKGTRLLDLVSLVGGMGEGTDLVLVASDGYKTTLPYTSIHTTPAIQAAISAGGSSSLLARKHLDQECLGAQAAGSLE